ncbi:MAG: hypothetical protein ACMXYK_02680 [Candidatus Woesearchaeota archaeon]
MRKDLVTISYGRSAFFKTKDYGAFNNDSEEDALRNDFARLLPDFNYNNFHKKKSVSSSFLHHNIQSWDSDEIYAQGDQLVVGEYCNHGVIVPQNMHVAFNKLRNCTPLISRMKGDIPYLSFLHVWAIPGDSDVVDRQVLHWMHVLETKGKILETIFAPRVTGSINDTSYHNAVKYIRDYSEKTIVFTRNATELCGVVNDLGVYFKDCGYRLWEN